PPAADERREIRHTIASGETLTSIFRRHGLSAATLQRVLDSDRRAAKRLAHLRPGQTLHLILSPEGLQRLELRQGDSLLARVQVPAAPRQAAAPIREIVHRVRQGQTLAAIFHRYGLTDATLMKVLKADRKAARQLRRLRPGDTLRLRADRLGRLHGLTLERRRGAPVSVSLMAAPAPQKRAETPPEPAPKPVKVAEASETPAEAPATRTAGAEGAGQPRITHQVKKGENLARIFAQHHIPDATLVRLLKENRSAKRDLERLRPGQTLQFVLDDQGRLQRLELERRGGKPLVATLQQETAPAEPAESSEAVAKTLPGPEPKAAEKAAVPVEPAVAEAAPETPAVASDTADDGAETTKEATVDPSQPQRITHKVKKGETLAGIFKQYGLSPAVAYAVLHSGKAGRRLSNIRPGQELALELAGDRLQSLRLVRNPIERIEVVREGERYRSRIVKKPLQRRLAEVSGVIHSSLFADGHKAGLSDGQIMQLAEIFGWDIDFALELRPGDQFRVVYEEQLVDGRKYRNGPILAAEFVNRGHTHQAFRFEHDGEVGYYDAKGRSKRRAFIRTPIRFARISSRFQPRRWHPVLGKWKSHKGVDYAAPRGTPIKATGDGRVIFRGWKRGYGRVVIIQHSRRYRTVYAHMSKFRGKVRKGSRVHQGEVIGYVGSSGWATGPHLHYEFRVNNVQRNPLTVKLPRSLPLPRRQLAQFRRQIKPLETRLASIRARSMVAR
ncbi:MAG TPA: LysM peptidoglycan-binding domain-containing protein, partial [Gammaproteobacteria bacterium]|nr:LysM peptidoglycan-binding domain-containing protein [Gammaproteobacteria bacterium]